MLPDIFLCRPHAELRVFLFYFKLGPVFIYLCAFTALRDLHFWFLHSCCCSPISFPFFFPHPCVFPLFSAPDLDAVFFFFSARPPVPDTGLVTPLFPPWLFTRYFEGRFFFFCPRFSTACPRSQCSGGLLFGTPPRPRFAVWPSMVLNRRCSGAPCWT